MMTEDSSMAVSPLCRGVRTWWHGYQQYLHDPRFWVVQGLVLLATVTHSAAELSEALHEPGIEHLFAVVMYALYAVPIIYASLNFGLEGAVPTAVWAAALSLPNVLIWHRGYERAADGIQHLVLIGLAIFIAERVDHEITARKAMEYAALARLRSETRYRTLFEAIDEPILVFDENGQIREVNRSAVALFGNLQRPLTGQQLADVLGGAAAAEVRSAATHGQKGESIRLRRPDGSDQWLAPVCGQVPAFGEQPVVQAIFYDVTELQVRQHGLELFARQIITAQEEERARIARELHDGPVQELIVLCRQMDDVSAIEPCSAAESRLRSMRRSAEAIAADLRRFSRDLRPSVLDDLGLVPAIRWLVQEFEQRTGVPTRFMSDDTQHRLERGGELALFRIAQEALRNIERHAEASEVFVGLHFDSHAAQLIVSDDGAGTDLGSKGLARLPTGKLGLLGMRERAQLCGGRLTVISEQGKGTRIDVEIPAHRPTGSDQERVSPRGDPRGIAAIGQGPDSR